MPWELVLDAMRLTATDASPQASPTVEQLIDRARTALHAGRANGLRVAQAVLNGYVALAGGVLDGMTERLQSLTAATSGRAQRRGG